MIVLFPEPEPQFTKILLITGGPHESGKKTEIIDLSNPNSTCDTWPSYPIEVDGAFGALLGTTILICGGEGGESKIPKQINNIIGPVISVNLYTIFFRFLCTRKRKTTLF